MAIIENADLKLEIEINADEEVDLITLVNEVKLKLKQGAIAGNGGGCIGSYSFLIIKRGAVNLNENKTALTEGE